MIVAIPTREPWLRPVKNDLVGSIQIAFSD